MAHWTHVEGAHDTLLCGCVKSTGGLQGAKHHHLSVKDESTQQNAGPSAADERPHLITDEQPGIPAAAAP